MLSSRLYATVGRRSRLLSLPYRATTAPVASALTPARLPSVNPQHSSSWTTRTFAIPAKPKKGSSAEGAKRPRAKKATAGKTTGSKPTKKETAAKAAAKKRADREKRERLKAREKARKVKAKALKAKPKALTPEQKAQKKARDAKEEIRALKAAALSPPPNPRRSSAWAMFNGEYVKSNASKSSGEVRSLESHQQQLREAVKEASRAFANLTIAERETYDQKALEHRRELQAVHKQWITSRSPAQIAEANAARRKLRSRLNDPKQQRKYARLEDDRIPKKPASAFVTFSTERHQSGDLAVLSLPERAKAIAQEWRATSDTRKQDYEANYQREKEDYVRRYTEVIGHAPGVTSREASVAV